MMRGDARKRQAELAAARNALAAAESYAQAAKFRLLLLESAAAVDAVEDSLNRVEGLS